MIFTPPENWPKLRIVRCGIGPRFTQAQTTAPPHEARFVCVGRLCPEKGHLLLLEATRRLIAEGVDLKLELIGDGPTRPLIERFIADHGLNDGVKLLGWQSSEVVAQSIRNSRALVLPSFAEGLPVVFMEAFALGRPVIATRIAGIAELVEDKASGWLIHPADVDDLVAALRDAASAHVEHIDAMGRHGREVVLARHCSATEVARLAEHLRSAISEGRPAPERSSDAAYPAHS